MSLIAEKKVFHIDSFSFQNGRTLPVQMGYETYGTLNADKSNAILVAHYFPLPAIVPENMRRTTL